LNGETQGTVKVDDKGQFEKELSLKQGENEIYAVAFDLLTNRSPQSEKIKVVLDQEPPPLRIDTPEEGKRFSQQNQVIEVRGQSEPEALLYFNNHLLVLDPEGKFATKFRLTKGENKLQFLARDQAGNESKRELKVFFD